MLLRVEMAASSCRMVESSEFGCGLTPWLSGAAAARRTRPLEPLVGNIPTRRASIERSATRYFLDGRSFQISRWSFQEPSAWRFQTTTYFAAAVVVGFPSG